MAKGKNKALAPEKAIQEGIASGIVKDFDYQKNLEALKVSRKQAK